MGLPGLDEEGQTVPMTAELRRDLMGPKSSSLTNTDQEFPAARRGSLARSGSGSILVKSCDEPNPVVATTQPFKLEKRRPSLSDIRASMGNFDKTLRTLHLDEASVSQQEAEGLQGTPLNKKVLKFKDNAALEIEYQEWITRKYSPRFQKAIAAMGVLYLIRGIVEASFSKFTLAGCYFGLVAFAVITILVVRRYQDKISMSHTVMLSVWLLTIMTSFALYQGVGPETFQQHPLLFAILVLTYLAIEHSLFEISFMEKLVLHSTVFIYYVVFSLVTFDHRFYDGTGDTGYHWYEGVLCLACIATVAIMSSYTREVLMRRDFLVRNWLAKEHKLLQYQSQALREDNANLRDEVTRLTTTQGPGWRFNQVDMESPIDKTLRFLSMVSEGHRPTDSEIHYLKHLLLSDNLHSINLGKQLTVSSDNVDSETSNWATSTFAVKKSNKANLRTEAGVRRRSQMITVPSNGDLMTYLSANDTSIPFYTKKKTDQKLSLILDELPNSWVFDTFFLHTITGNRSLQFAGFQLLDHHDLITKLGVSPKKLWAFLNKIENSYRADNPYHNSIHGADVAKSFHYLVSRPEIVEHLTDLEMFSGIIASLIHDVDHPGVNNDFLQKTRHDWSVLYNDQSVLENHHLATAFQIVYTEPECDIFEGLGPSEKKEARRLIIDMVMATDLGKHFDMVGVFKAKTNEKDGIDLLTSPNVTETTLVLQLAIKCADVGHTATSGDLHKKWSLAVTEEMFRQGDREKENGLPVSGLMDRGNTFIPKSQVGFFEFIVLPLFEAFASAWPEEYFAEQLAIVNKNYSSWQQELMNDPDAVSRATSNKNSRRPSVSDEESPMGERSRSNSDEGGRKMGKKVNLSISKSDDEPMSFSMAPVASSPQLQLHLHVEAPSVSDLTDDLSDGEDELEAAAKT
eukprot:GFYU01002962.1.p1 GENE.GFYU01002962.1~~GFYU01002962.1.p1  ORF type:complete len:911 (+),score=237.50 GFYU01002962.1:616-3348(+)